VAFRVSSEKCIAGAWELVKQLRGGCGFHVWCWSLKPETCREGRREEKMGRKLEEHG